MLFCLYIMNTSINKIHMQFHYQKSQTCIHMKNLTQLNFDQFNIAYKHSLVLYIKGKDINTINKD